MAHLLIVFIHLVATSVAVGLIVLTDIRLITKLLGYRVVIAPPRRSKTRMIMIAMTTLVVSGAALVLTGMAADPNYLSNPKLQAKILLVALLVANAFALHHGTFPRLARGRPVAAWTLRDHLTVAIPAALSNSLWMYCAFLGIARAWNGVVPAGQVLGIAAILFMLGFIGVSFALRFAARDEPKGRPDWIDSMKTRLSDYYATPWAA